MVIASGTRKGFISEVQDGESWRNKEDFTWESRRALSRVEVGLFKRVMVLLVCGKEVHGLTCRGRCRGSGKGIPRDNSEKLTGSDGQVSDLGLCLSPLSEPSFFHT